MAAVWAAGPEPIMMTFECIVGVLDFGGKVEKGVLRLEVEGEERRGAGRVCRDAGVEVYFGWKVEAAARVTPKDERRGARRKAEENSVLVWRYLGGKFLGCTRFIVESVYSVDDAEASDMESR